MIVIFTRQLFSVLAIAVLGAFISQPCYASDKTKVLIFLPELGANYNAVFEKIIHGIDGFPGVESSTIIISKQTKLDDISSQIADNDIDAIISLGQKTYDFAHQFKDQLPVVHGGLLLNPNGHNGISLIGSPKHFFSKLVKIAPQVKRVFTVYNEKNSGWIIQLAEVVANKHNIELKAYAADNVREAVHKFQHVLDQTRDEHDAVWILLDNIVPDKSVLPLALKVAWEKRIVIFSNNPSHTKRGALFSLFPNHQGMGSSLASLTLNILAEKNSGPSVVPLENLKVALNERTASHIGLRYSRALRDEFDIIYPLR